MSEGSDGLAARTDRRLLGFLPNMPRSFDGALPSGFYRFVRATGLRQQVVLALFTCIVFPLSLVPLELQRRMVDDAIGERRLDLLLLLAGLYVALVLLHGGLKFLRNLYQGRIGEGTIRLLRERAARLHGTDDGESGSEVTVFSAEAEGVGAFAGEAISFPLLQGGIIVSVLGYMLWLQPLICLVALAFAVPSLVLAPIVQRHVNRLAAQRTTTLRTASDELLAEDGDREARLMPGIERIYGLRLRIFVLKFFVKFFNNLMGHMGPVSVLAFGGWLVIEGSTQLGTIVAFISGFEKINDPARELLGFYRRMSQMQVQYGLLRDKIGEA